MKPTLVPHSQQANFLYQDLLDQLDPKDLLLQLSRKIPWDYFDAEFAPLYAECGRPAKPIRLMVGLLLLKQLENLSDERVVEEWRRNPYFQAFCGERFFQWKSPCEPSDLCHFRKRIGEAGAEKIFKASIGLHGKAAMEPEVVVDTTVQEKNITFPTDTKLRLKVIERCWKLAKKGNLKLRRSYSRELDKLKRIIRFEHSSKALEKKRAARRIKTIANALVNDVRRKLRPEVAAQMEAEFEIWLKAINQKRKNKNKIYSLHEPEVFCIGKGKEQKKYEFGTKVVIAQTKNNGIIVGACNALNAYDGHTLEGTLSQIKRLVGQAPKTAFCDRGFKGNDRVLETAIVRPEAPKPGASEYEKRKAKKNFRMRSAIEATNSHLKHDFRMLRNYLKGRIGDTVNIFLAAAAYNLRKWMRVTALLGQVFFCVIFWTHLSLEKEAYKS